MRIKALTTLFFALGTAISLSYGQDVPSLGLQLDDTAYLEVPYTSENLQVESGQKSIPLQLDLTPHCPPVRNQGEVESCVGWSVGYAAMTIERAVQKNWKSKRQLLANANSAMFLYNQVTGEQCLGITMASALEYLETNGNCLARDFDTNVADCKRQPDSTIIEKAKKFRIEEYIRLFEPNDEDKVRNVKLVLAQNKPVIVGMKVLKNFYQIQPGDESWIPTVGDATYLGGHAMVVVGYDDQKFHAGSSEVAADMKGAFKIMNSWGPNWGSEGFIWVRYAHFQMLCRHAYAIRVAGGQAIDFDLDMTPERLESEDLVSMHGTFSFRHFTGQWVGDQPLFKVQPVELKNNHYQLPKRTVGERFQLDIRSDFDDGYVYVFSVDPRGKTEVHFPRSEQYNEKFSGQNESAWVMHGGSTITVPTTNSTLEITRVGQDNMIVLYSKRKIKPRFLQYLGKEIYNSKAPVEETLPELLKKHVVPFDDIQYGEEAMGFDVNTTSRGKIVPIILKIQAQ